ncbi:hypothetical protein ACRRTK_017647 [Alexandromys fortis]
MVPSLHRCFRQRQAPPNGHHFPSPLRFSPSVHDIGSFIQKYRKKKLASEEIITLIN